MIKLILASQFQLEKVDAVGNFLRAGLSLAFCLALTSAAYEDTIVAVSGPANAGFGNRVFAASWTETSQYVNVSVTADVFGVRLQV